MNDDGLSLIAQLLGLTQAQFEELAKKQKEQLEKLSRESSRTPLEGEDAERYLTAAVQTCYPTPISFQQ